MGDPYNESYEPLFYQRTRRNDGSIFVTSAAIRSWAREVIGFIGILAAVALLVSIVARIAG